jgi:hypothetical protein
MLNIGIIKVKVKYENQVYIMETVEMSKEQIKLVGYILGQYIWGWSMKECKNKMVKILQSNGYTGILKMVEN